MMDQPGTCPDVPDLAEYLDATTDSNDAWGRPFRIVCEGYTLHVSSSGPDATHDTEDDVGF